MKSTGSQFGRGHPPAKEKPQFVNVFRVDPPTSSSKPLHELKPSECHWPQWHQWSINALFCGKPTHSDSPYCKEHFKRSYSPTIRGVKIG